MGIYGKEWEYSMCSCCYCHYWKSPGKGCTYENGCCCDIPKTPLRAKRCSETTQIIQPQSPISECARCPYGRDSPCIGWCTKMLLIEMGRWPG
jgi:hypothetical protein